MISHGLSHPLHNIPDRVTAELFRLVEETMEEDMTQATEDTVAE